MNCGSFSFCMMLTRECFNINQMLSRNWCWFLRILSLVFNKFDLSLKHESNVDEYYKYYLLSNSKQGWSLSQGFL